LQIQGLILVAAIYAILAICLDATADILGLYSLGVGGFFAIGAYLTTILSTIYNVNAFLLIPIIVVTTGLLGVILGAASLRVSGLHFAITTFIFTLVVTVLADPRLRLRQAPGRLDRTSREDVDDALQF
jgi:branched-chain amino acid transport system permease protein